MHRKNYYQWIKLWRRYRKVQAKLVEFRSERIHRKLDILRRRLISLNRRWKLGISSTVLTLWLSTTPQELKAQGSIFPQNFDLSSLNGTNGFVLEGEAGTASGQSISTIGDFNGDGKDDFIIGADRADPNGSYSGISYVVFGRDTGYPSSLELSSLSGSDGFSINGVVENDYSGSTVSNGGDLNGDGIDDLVIGAYRSDPNGDKSGTSYVVFGSEDAFLPSIELSSLNGTNGLKINGVAIGDYSGKSLASAGDINGDGIDDLIIGAPGADPNSNNDSGSGYVVFGKNDGFSSPIELSALNGTSGFIINGVAAGDRLGWSVSGVGDVNGDSVDDIILGADQSSPNGDKSGSSYIIFGGNTVYDSPLDLSALGNNGIVIKGVSANDYSV